MGWQELFTFVRVMNEQAQGGNSDPDTWDGGRDDWWKQQDERRAKMRGWN